MHAFATMTVAGAVCGTARQGQLRSLYPTHVRRKPEPPPAHTAPSPQQGAPRTCILLMPIQVAPSSGVTASAKRSGAGLPSANTRSLPSSQRVRKPRPEVDQEVWPAGPPQGRSTEGAPLRSGSSMGRGMGPAGVPAGVSGVAAAAPRAGQLRRSKVRRPSWQRRGWGSCSRRAEKPRAAGLAQPPGQRVPCPALGSEVPPLGKDLMPSNTSTAPSAQSGVPSGLNTGRKPLGQQRCTKCGRGRPTCGIPGGQPELMGRAVPRQTWMLRGGKTKAGPAETRSRGGGEW